jgi:hypothetical protein
MLRFLTEVSFGPAGFAREEEERRQQRWLTPSDRKLRLFACACCRQADEARHPVAVGCVHVAEQVAEGLAGSRERGEAYNRADNIPNPIQRLWAQACLRASALGGAFDVVTHLGRPGQAHLLREIVGNPFRAVARWEPHQNLLSRGWWVRQIGSLAQAAYDERQPDSTLDPARLLVLSDALEEAGCTEDDGGTLCDECVKFSRAQRWEFMACHGTPTVTLADGLLRHLRSPGPHVRGCHVVDSILGRE